MKAIWVLIPVVMSGLAIAQAPRVGKGDISTQPQRPGEVQSPEAPYKSSDPNVGVIGVNPLSYLIGGEDVIHITTWRQPDFTFTTVVRPDGKINVPLAGEMQAGGKTPSALEKEISKALSTYIQSPEVTVMVLDVRSKKFYIIGEVLRPGQVPLIGPTTVMEALSATGFAPFANKKKIRILRGKETFTFNFNEVSNGKHLEQNIQLENGDYIIVK
ncbi:MAG TPA: polysaccharide biosynthesis/export family protein [Bryobacteraceae bacterium]